MTNTGSLLPEHLLVTSYPATWCSCGYRLPWERREQVHAFHVLAVVWSQGADAAAATIPGGIGPIVNPYEGGPI